LTSALNRRAVCGKSCQDGALELSVGLRSGLGLGGVDFNKLKRRRPPGKEADGAHPGLGGWISAVCLQGEAELSGLALLAGILPPGNTHDVVRLAGDRDASAARGDDTVMALMGRLLVVVDDHHSRSGPHREPC